MINLRKIAIIICIVLISGCANLQPFVQQGLEEKEKYEEGKLETGEYLTCSDPSVLSLVKRYKTKAELARWWTFCLPQYENIFTQ